MKSESEWVTSLRKARWHHHYLLSVAQAAQNKRLQANRRRQLMTLIVELSGPGKWFNKTRFYLIKLVVNSICNLLCFLWHHFKHQAIQKYPTNTIKKKQSCNICITSQIRKLGVAIPALNVLAWSGLALVGGHNDLNYRSLDPADNLNLLEFNGALVECSLSLCCNINMRANS